MKKILVFSSKTGNTKKIALSISEKIKPDFIGDVSKFDVIILNKEDLIIVDG